MRWDPESYLRYRGERDRPFHDLLSRVTVEAPRAVVDVGCGTGHLTAGLASRWPQARISGFDSSVEMIAQASALRVDVDFTVTHAEDWTPGPDVDLLVSNAVLQWVPGHEELLVRWARQMPAGAELAVAVPGNFDAPSHRALRAVAGDPRWRDRVRPALREAPVTDAAGYATLLRAAGCTVDAWETTYLHVLSDTDTDTGTGHPVRVWMEGTALRPVRAALADDERAWVDLRHELDRRLADHYPVGADRAVYFPFRRIFSVARIGVRP